ncbi:MAG: hypothetical protein M1828_004352 [Chrysothrix sp. TS-e1954]|nr:MAG: hypothetical protein M1828_004352 [Chrysothrix sp. TS-e1954]
MCCSPAKKAKREARALRARLAHEEAVLVSYRAQEAALLHSKRVHEGIALKVQKAHEAAAIQVERAEADLDKLKREWQAHDQGDTQHQQIQQNGNTIHVPVMEPTDGRPPAYADVVDSASPRFARPQQQYFGREGHLDSSDNDDDDKGSEPSRGTAVDIHSLPPDHPVHKMSAGKVERLRRQGVDPALRAEMDEIARVRGQVGFWSRRG